MKPGDGGVCENDPSEPPDTKVCVTGECSASGSAPGTEVSRQPLENYSCYMMCMIAKVTIGQIGSEVWGQTASRAPQIIGDAMKVGKNAASSPVGTAVSVAIAHDFCRDHCSRVPICPIEEGWLPPGP